MRYRLPRHSNRETAFVFLVVGSFLLGIRAFGDVVFASGITLSGIGILLLASEVRRFLRSISIRTRGREKARKEALNRYVTESENFRISRRPD